MKIKQTLLFLACFTLLSLLWNSSATAQEGAGMYCVSSYEQLMHETLQKEQSLAFAGITRAGLPLWFFKNEENFTVFFKSRLTGKYCTAPNYFGKIIDVTPMEEQELGEPT